MPPTAVEPVAPTGVVQPTPPTRHRRRRQATAALCALACSALLGACSPKQKLGPENFVGKWQSSKMPTPIYLYSNGEWEIKQDNGVVVEYGVWEYKEGSILWTYKNGARMLHESDRVVTYTTREFQLIEKLGVTVFTRLD